MKVRTFLLVAFIFVVIIVGASVGGAVGGKSVRDNTGTFAPAYTSTSSIASATSTPTSTHPPTGLASSISSTTSSTTAAATPTIQPTSDCPSSNATTYAPAQSSSGSSSSTHFTFTKYCQTKSPFDKNPTRAAKLAQAFFYTFNDCIDLCAGFNAISGQRNCSAVAYQVGVARPSGNCWVGSVQELDGAYARSLGFDAGTDVALLA
ncbi:hypothetical protein LTR28_010449 [Elasticomyces elasticus]|nr:hypothetical protein LTR28_010449 [Elasticomyces elasticus]